MLQFSVAGEPIRPYRQELLHDQHCWEMYRVVPLKKSQELFALVVTRTIRLVAQGSRSLSRYSLRQQLETGIGGGVKSLQN